MEICLRGTTETLPDGSIVDYGVYVDEETLRRVLRESATKARKPEVSREQEIACTLKTSVRAYRSRPPIWQLLKLQKIGCGSEWHYEGHSFHSACPTCGSREVEVIDKARIEDTARNFDRIRSFPS